MMRYKDDTLNFDARGISPELQLRLYRTMLRIRRFEEAIIEVYGAQDMKTPVHLYIGEEAVASAVSEYLRKTDYVFTTHRSHGHCLAKGMSAYELYAEFYGRTTGCCHGKGGSMHPANPEWGVLGTTAIVGGGIPNAAGAALAAKMTGTGAVSIAYFGDGASEEGSFHETLSWSAMKKLPVVFVCENNYYATNSPLSARQPNPDVHRRAEGYGIPALLVDGNNVLDVYRAAGEAIGRARAGEGPSFLECKTYRWKGHVGPDCDHEKGCRPRQDLLDWERRCPVERFREYLFDARLMTEEAHKALLAEINREMYGAIERARADPLPAPSELYENVYYERKG